jgi:hypothetical protein
MKRFIHTLFCVCLLACSPYKKITLTMSDRLTQRWKGSTEGAVVRAIGSYTGRETQSGGYFLRFDYSYASAGPARNNSGMQVRVSNQPNTFTPRSDNSHPDARTAQDSVIKRLEFYFDQSHHVQYVMATGYPDSVYYVKRK